MFYELIIHDSLLNNLLFISTQYPSDKLVDFRSVFNLKVDYHNMRERIGKIMFLLIPLILIIGLPERVEVQD